MPYATIKDLPDGIRNSLPLHAQKIYKAAFNSACEEHRDKKDAEAIAHRVAWSAVKQQYEKSGGRWHKTQ